MVLIQGGPFAGYRAMFDQRGSGNERVQVPSQLLEAQQVKVEAGSADSAE